MSRFSIFDYGVFGAYLAVGILIGCYFSRGQKDLKSYFLAGQSMGYVLVGVSVLAALFSGISYLAVPSEVYAHGMGFFLVVLSFILATPITILVFLPFFYRSRFYTAYQYLEERFSAPVRLMASSLFILRVLVWLALATYAPALAIQQVTGLPVLMSVLCIGILTTFFTSVGGMKAVIWMDVIQLFVLVGGQLLILAIALHKIPGGIHQVWQIGQEHGKFAVSFSFSLTKRITFAGAIIGGLFLNLVQMATDQVSVQRYLTATSLKEAQRALWLKLWIVLPIVGIFYLTGLVLFAFYRIHGDPLASGLISKSDQILPYFVIHELPAGMPGLLIAAVFGASMNTISAGINAVTSVTVIDFCQRLRKGERAGPDARELKLAKLLTVLYGALVMMLAFEAPRLGTLLEASNKVIGLVGGPLLGLFLLGMLFKRANAPGAVIGWFAGVSVLIPVCFFSDVSFLWYTLIGFIVTISFGWTSSWLFPAPAPSQLRGLTLSRSSSQPCATDFPEIMLVSTEKENSP
jgi:sodium-coupled monocarboxylate transporter 8/12